MPTVPKVIGPARLLSAQKIAAQVPKPTVQIPMYQAGELTPRHFSQFVATQRRSTAALCHIHRRPQFSRTAAWCVSRNARLRRSRRLEERAETGSPARYASRSCANSSALA